MPARRSQDGERPAEHGKETREKLASSHTVDICILHCARHCVGLERCRRIDVIVRPLGRPGHVARQLALAALPHASHFAAVCSCYHPSLAVAADKTPHSTPSIRFGFPSAVQLQGPERMTRTVPSVRVKPFVDCWRRGNDSRLVRPRAATNARSRAPGARSSGMAFSGTQRREPRRESRRYREAASYHRYRCLARRSPRRTYDCRSGSSA
jgi:hypothetical protein